MKSLPESVSILLDNCFQNNNIYSYIAIVLLPQAEMYL